eukprot:s596_g7.t2
MDGSAQPVQHVTEQSHEFNGGKNSDFGLVKACTQQDQTMAKDVRNPEFWNKFMQRPEVQAAMRSKLKYESAAEAAQRTKLDKLERKQRRYEIMDELMKCATNIKHLISPMFRYKITQQYLWKVLCEARKEGMLFCDKLRQPQVYHRLQAIKAEITAGPYGVAGWQAEEEVEEDLMDKMVVEADCIPGGIDGEAPDRKQVLDRREIQGVLDFGQKIKTEGNEAFLNENWEGALTRYCQGDEMLKNFAAEPHLDKENKELKTMHRQCLNNKANAALQMDQWQTALRAAESALKLKMDDEKALFRKAQALEGLGRTDEALEVLDEVEQIAEDMDEDFREQILDDVKERREEIKAIEHKAAKSFNNMFKAMGDKQVFGSGRFLADGTSPPPALTGAEERQLKRIKEQDEYRAAKLKYELEQRRKDLQRLKQLNGLPQMELYTVFPSPEQRSAPLAAQIFADAGFVLLPRAVPPALCRALAAACREEERAMLQRDPGEAQKTGHLLHRPEWTALIDLEKVTPVLQQIFEGDDYLCAGAGGDFVRPGVTEYQPLHVDLDFPGCRDHPENRAPVVTLNVALEPLTRIIPGTHCVKEGWADAWEPPSQMEEPEASDATRFLPNVEFAASWWCVASTEELWRNPWKLAPRGMPRQLWSRMVVTDKDLDYGEGKPLVDLPQEPEMPTPNKPPLGFRTSERTRTLTKAQAQQLLELSTWDSASESLPVACRVLAMAPTGVAAFQYGTGEKSCLSQPRGVHLDEDGNLYVADFGNFCVVRFSTGDGNGPGRVVVGQRGKQLLDVDYLKDIDKPLAPADGEGVLLKNPIDVALNADGSVLVLDCPMGRVQCFEQGAKTSLATVMVPPPRSMPAKSLAVPEAIKHPRSMLHLSDGSLVICDTWSHRILKYNKDAMTPELLAGSPNSCGCSETQLNFPSSAAFAPDGRLFVADTNNHRIQRFQPGELTGVTVAGSAAGKAGDGLWELCMPTGLAVEADGALLVADRGNARLMSIREGSEPQQLLGPELLERPWGLAIDREGGIFVSDERRGIVLRLLPSGAPAPANAKPAVAPVKTPAPTPAAAPPAAGGYPQVVKPAAFQPPSRVPAAPAPAPAPAPAAAATPAAVTTAAVFQPPERPRAAEKATVPAGEPPKLQPKEEAQPKAAVSHVAKDPLGLDDLD